MKQVLSQIILQPIGPSTFHILCGERLSILDFLSGLEVNSGSRPNAAADFAG